MEWVETTGRSVAEALDVALDQLGVDESEVEYEVVAEPRGGLFGRFGGSDARIRARVRPVSREKPGDRRRRRGGGSGGGDGRGRSRSGGRSGGNGGDGGSNGSDGSTGPRRSTTGRREPAPAGDPTDASREPRKRRRRRGRSSSAGSSAGIGSGSGVGAGGAAGAGDRVPTTHVDGGANEVSVSDSQVSIDEQATAATLFLEGLVAAFGMQASVVAKVDDDTVAVEVDGSEVGLLVGPRGATLSAIEELTRTVVQRHAEGHGARLTVDVGGYRAKRRAALAEFTLGLVSQVLANGTEIALEPMSAADRKVVHDTVGEIDGVTTYSEGEEPRRRVVIQPAD